MELVIVVGVEQVVFAIVLVVEDDLQVFEPLLEGFGGGVTLACAQLGLGS